jgi:hypothetical protein
MNNLSDRRVPTSEVVDKICQAIYDLDNTVLEMTIACKKAGGGYERLEKYEAAATQAQEMYIGMLNMVTEYKKIWKKYIETESANQELLQRIKTLEQIDQI